MPIEKALAGVGLTLIVLSVINLAADHRFGNIIGFMVGWYGLMAFERLWDNDAD